MTLTRTQSWASSLVTVHLLQLDACTLLHESTSSIAMCILTIVSPAPSILYAATIHPLISNHSIVSERALLRTESRLQCQKWSLYMYKIEGSIFHAHLYRRAEKLPTWRWPGLFYSQLQQPPCAVTWKVTPATSPCLTLSTSTEPTVKSEQ